MIYEPHMSHYIDPSTSEIDYYRFIQDLNEFERLKSLEGHTINPRREHAPRNCVKRPNYSQSSWFIDYIVDERKIFDDANSRQGKLFRKRFCVDKCHVMEIVAKMRSDGIYHEVTDAVGRACVPLDLLVRTVCGGQKSKVSDFLSSTFLQPEQYL